MRRVVMGGLAVVVALGAIGVVTLGGASAASLTVGGATITAVTVAHPCPGTLAATTPSTTGSVSTVQVTPPAACAGRTVAVAVSDGTVVRQGTALAPASGSVTVALDGAYVPGVATTVAATVDGWSLPTTWSYVPGVRPAIRCWTSDPARPCSASVTVRDAWSSGYNLDITITDTRATNANNPVPWTIEIDFSNARYPFVPNALEGSGVVPAANACGARPVMTFTGVTTWGEHNMLRRDTQRTVWIQARNDGSGAILDCVP